MDSREVGRVVGTPIVKDGLLYVGDLGGTVHCLDATTGAHLWKHETNDAIWGSLLLAGDRLYAGNEGGLMTVLRAGRRKELLAQIEMDAPLYSRPAVVGDALYLATANRRTSSRQSIDPKRALRASISHSAVVRLRASTDHQRRIALLFLQLSGGLMRPMILAALLALSTPLSGRRPPLLSN